jgi:tetratricopeptide (TPR) repeat protein
LSYHQKALDIVLLQESSALNKEYIGDAYGNIAAVYLLNGSYREAIGYFEKEISTKLEIMTCHSPAFVITYSNLANAYLSINEYSTAIKYLHQALDISKKILPKYHENVTAIYNAIGIIYKEQGKLDQALHYFELSLEGKLNCLPVDHPSLAAPYNNLACTFASMLNYDRSVKNFENALAIFEKHENLKNPALATLNANIGLCYYQLDQLDKADDFLQRSLTILRLIYNDGNHFQFAYTYNALALVKCAQGSFEKAEGLCQKALDLRLTELPSDNIDIGLSFETFGIVYNAQKKYDDALVYFRKSEIIVENINKEYPILVRIFRAIGSVFYNQVVYSKAMEYYIKAIELALKIYATNEKVIDALNYGVDRIMDNVF